MDMQKMAQLAKDPESRKVILDLVLEMKEELYPIIELVKEAVGEDLDRGFDEVLIWGARKTKILYTAFREEGFSHDDAIALVCNSRREIAATLRSAR